MHFGSLNTNDFQDDLYQQGVTLLEVLITTAILAGMAAVSALVLNIFSKTTQSLESSGRSTLSSQRLFIHFEKDLYSANEIVTASDHEIRFKVDISRSPTFNPTGDIDGDDIPNYLDSDMDNDIDLFATAGPADQWKHGYNLVDDDEDGDGFVDMVLHYFLEGDTLIRDYQLNGEPWGLHKRKIATGIKEMNFTYFGSKENDLGSRLDVGHDGLEGTSDTGEGDGIIDQIEIDMAESPVGHGDQSEALDHASELQYITAVRIHIKLDSSAGGGDQPDLILDTEINPPLLPLKPIQRI